MKHIREILPDVLPVRLRPPMSDPTLGRKCRVCGEHKLPEGYYWRTNASGNRSLVSTACKACRNKAHNAFIKKRTATMKESRQHRMKESRQHRMFGHATLSMVNPSLPPGTTRHRRILAGGGFLHITETNP